MREALAECEAEGVGDSVYMLTAPNRYPTLATRTLMDFIRLHLERQAENWGRRNLPAATANESRAAPAS
jgi:hypothetical protein